ncbi:protein SPIRAL1-like 1 isoform X2 [Phoenix dactylifera]|nr:protein SPIRAL1-like 1 isoform X2 [Phoenix dactylifera]XP_026664701.1 protein SPIRAL1-like 1 isoform X2 [Phoenix dactylifera]
MGRGVSSGGGQSSLGYLFGSDETPKPAANQTSAADDTAHSQKPSTASPPVDVSKQIPAGIQQKTANNYHRSDGQNSGNFLTDRPSTKVQAAPGGGSSLSYLFGGGGN